MFKLVVRNLRAHWVRSLLTLLSVAVAVALVCVLRATLVGLESAVTNAAADRVWVQSAVSLYVDLPLAYESKIANVDGVDTACKMQWFGGLYQDRSNFFAQFAVDTDEIVHCYPEMEIVKGSEEAFRSNRTGCMIGRGLAEKYGFEVGGKIPIIGTIFPRGDGSPWEFEVEAIYASKRSSLDEMTMYFDFAYLEESIEAGTVEYEPGKVGVYLAKIADGAPTTQVMAEIDGLFENGPQRVQATTEAEFSRQFLSMLGNVPALIAAIGGAVLFAIFFAVLNTMLAAGRERVRDVGVLKSLGFGDGFVSRTLIAESLLICAVGGALGIGLAYVFEGAIQKQLAGTVQSFAIAPETIGLGFGIAVAIGLIAGLAPAMRAGRIAPVEALRAEA